MPLNKDSLGNTLIVATVLCLVCALLVSTAAVGLKSIQDANALLDRRTNIVSVSGLSDEDVAAAGGVDKLFGDGGRIEAFVIDLDTGELAPDACQEAMTAAGKSIEDIIKDYDQIWCSKSKKTEVAQQLDKKTDTIGIKWREKFSHVFIVKDSGGQVAKYVFPVRGYGLWSMMQGFMAVDPDLQTVAGLTFYEHGETPGLGGEITNPQWKKKWIGKKIYDNSEVNLAVLKGDQSGDPYAVDALSGATITSNGVTNLIDFWMGPNGFGPYIANNGGPAPKADPAEEKEEATTANKTPAMSGVNHG
jgi:Na+-transporting NADH:ubiquinone oxidoreductase subunit C